MVFSDITLIPPALVFLSVPSCLIWSSWMWLFGPFDLCFDILSCLICSFFSGLDLETVSVRANWDSERCSDFPKVTQLVKGNNGVSEFSYLPPCFLPLGRQGTDSIPTVGSPILLIGSLKLYLPVVSSAEQNIICEKSRKLLTWDPPKNANIMKNQFECIVSCF